MKAAKDPRNVQYLIGCDAVDHPTHDPSNMYYDAQAHGIYWLPSTCSVECNNELAKLCTGHLLVMLQDDVPTPPCQGWDEQLLSALPANWRDITLVPAIGDGIHNPAGSNLLCHICMTRLTYEERGYFVHPSYRHFHADDHHSLLSYKRGQVHDLRRKIVWKHEHQIVQEEEVSHSSPGMDSHRLFWDYAKPAIDSGRDLPLGFRLPE